MSEEQTSITTPEKRKGPIIVLAPMGRSGTSFMRHFLTQHPETTGSIIKEDYFLLKSHLISEYAAMLSKKWELPGLRNHVPDRLDSYDKLLHGIGDSLLAFVTPEDKPDHTRLVLKTPSLTNLATGIKLFPKAQFIIMVRDPRSIAASWQKVKFDWINVGTLDKHANTWAANMREFGDVLTENQDAVKDGRIIIARFEEMATDPKSYLPKILEKLDLDVTPDIEEYMDNPPVVGSSFASRKENGRINFVPVPRPENFDPLVRWQNWTPEMHGRFNRICGALMQRWGYKPVVSNS